jgi:hypothetical protein
MTGFRFAVDVTDLCFPVEVTDLCFASRDEVANTHNEPDARKSQRSCYVNVSGHRAVLSTVSAKIDP